LYGGVDAHVFVAGIYGLRAYRSQVGIGVVLEAYIRSKRDLQETGTVTKMTRTALPSPAIANHRHLRLFQVQQ
jgi:hypothetical protein